MRAREHVDFQSIHHQGSDEQYFGLSNTINFGFEKRGSHYYALYFNPVIGNSKRNKSSTFQLSKKVKFWMAGVEIKENILNSSFFGRLGLGWSLLDAEAKSWRGMNSMISAGYEFKATESLAISPDIGIRYHRFSSSTYVMSATVSVGLHFYDFKLPDFF